MMSLSAEIMVYWILSFSGAFSFRRVVLPCGVIVVSCGFVVALVQVRAREDKQAGVRNSVVRPRRALFLGKRPMSPTSLPLETSRNSVYRAGQPS